MSWRLALAMAQSEVVPLNSSATALSEALAGSVAACVGATVALAGGGVLVLLGAAVGVAGGAVGVTAWVSAMPKTSAMAVPVADAP